jgi:hypothetical protein
MIRGLSGRWVAGAIFFVAAALIAVAAVTIHYHQLSPPAVEPISSAPTAGPVAMAVNRPADPEPLIVPAWKTTAPPSIDPRPVAAPPVLSPHPLAMPPAIPPALPAVVASGSTPSTVPPVAATAPPRAQPSTSGQMAELESAPLPNPLRQGQRPALGTAVVEPQVKQASAWNVTDREVPKALVPEGKKPFGKGKHSGIPFDPLKVNGPIFADWPKEPPKVALLITGRQEGYFEPCGCAGLDRMRGGVSRRYSLIKQLRKKQWPSVPNVPVVPIDLGGLGKGFGREAELKFHTTVDAYRQMGYVAIGLGLTDLRLPGLELLTETGNTANQKSPFVCANAGPLAIDSQTINSFQVVTAGGMRFGITAVLGKQYQALVQNTEIIMADPVQKLTEVLPELKKQADYLILLAFATEKESEELGQKFPDFKIVVTAGGGAEPPALPGKVAGSGALLVKVGEKTMNALVVGLFDDPQTPWRYQRVPLDSRFPPSHEMTLLMEAFQDQLKNIGFEALFPHRIPHPQRQLLGNFVGSQHCEPCHEESYKVWKRAGGHSLAYDTLQNAKPPRNYDPECVSCHVVGWNGQGFFPYQGGFESLQKTPLLAHVGCESCHGPGEKHIAAEATSDNALKLKLQKAMVLTREEAKKQFCTNCHDIDNSPDFNFEAYWPQIEHHEKE